MKQVKKYREDLKTLLSALREQKIRLPATWLTSDSPIQLWLATQYMKIGHVKTVK